ncbi:MAG: InlB B-repeat-containing protein [Actinomycetes bacterium]|jgi:uncharacterized repeat protein (TIGR02543 family)|nr:InlB B-repeat-containing protein [Actinomycetes bacterium]
MEMIDVTDNRSRRPGRAVKRGLSAGLASVMLATTLFAALPAFGAGTYSQNDSAVTTQASAESAAQSVVISDDFFSVDSTGTGYEYYADARVLVVTGEVEVTGSVQCNDHIMVYVPDGGTVIWNAEICTNDYLAIDLYLDGGSFRMIGGVIETTVEGMGDALGVFANVPSTVTIEGGRIATHCYDGFGITSNGQVTVVIAGGEVESENGVAVQAYQIDGLEISGGTVSGKTRAVVSADSDFTVSGGTLTAEVVIEADQAQVTGGTLVAGDEGALFIMTDDAQNFVVDGNAVLRTNASDESTAVVTGGILFQDKAGTVIGDVQLGDDLTVADDEELVIPEGSSLTVPEGVTFQNLGTVVQEGDVYNQGGTVVDESGDLEVIELQVPDTGKPEAPAYPEDTDPAKPADPTTPATPDPKPPVSTPTEVKVTFNVNGGKALSKKSATRTVVTGKKYGKLPTPTRTGYKFAGWYTKKTGGKKVSASTIAGSKNVTLYARWKAQYGQLKKGVSAVNVRSKATAASKIKGHATKKATIRIIGKVDRKGTAHDWYKVKVTRGTGKNARTVTGYVYAQFVKAAWK